VKLGDEVILPTYVCRSVFDAVRNVGGQPVFCDIGEHWNMTSKTVAAAFTKKTRAIIVVHIFGIAENTEPFKQFNVPIIEDCCQAFGASINGRFIGTIGDICVVSFHATKCLTTGEGGMALSNNSETAKSLGEIFQNNEIASPMGDIQAALGLCQLMRYNVMLKKRRRIAKTYFHLLPEHLTRNIREVKDHSMFFRFPILIEKEFEALKRQCEEEEFTIRKGVDSLLHRQEKLSDAKFPMATGLFDKTVSLPIYPNLSENQVDHIVRTICKLSN